jgi:hypothetical protein
VSRAGALIEPLNRNRCRIRVGPFGPGKLGDREVGLHTIPGILSVVTTMDRRLAIDYDPARLPTATLIAHLELQGILEDAVRWVADPCPEAS